MLTNEVFEDAFNLLCGKLIGEGIHRKVYECTIRPDLVVKVESDEFRSFSNVVEHKLYSDTLDIKNISKWLAPCEFLSPDGRILLQKKCDKVPSNYKLPEKLPTFLNDVKIDNFGILNGKLVCVDYAIHNSLISTKLVKCKWY